MFDWIKPQVNTQTVNVLDVLCHKISKSNSKSAMEKMETSSQDNSSLIRDERHSECTSAIGNMAIDSSVIKTNCNNTIPFNIDIFQTSKDNIDLYSIANDGHHDLKQNNDSDLDKGLFELNHNFHLDEKHQLKKEEKSTEPFAQNILKDTDKKIMNLTNFYNDAQNQINVNSESESSLYGIEEKSQYESVTVLKTEPILDNSVVQSGNQNIINNLDDAVFIFQNKIDVPDSFKKDEEEIYSKEAFNISNLNIIKTDAPQDEIEKPLSTLKVINLKSASLHQFQPPTDTKCNSGRENMSSVEKNHSNFINPHGLISVTDPVSPSQNKAPNNAVNFKYISFPEKSDTSKIILNSKNVKFPIIHMQLPEASLPSLKVIDSKNDKAAINQKINSSSVKYFVKDKNVFKLLYLNPTRVENATNFQIKNEQDKCNNGNSFTSLKKNISNLKPKPSIPKLLHFDSQRNSTVDISKVVMKTSEKRNGTNIVKDSSSPKQQSVNIIYQPIKHTGVVGSKNLIVTFPHNKIQNKSNNSHNENLPAPSEKNDKKLNVNPICAHKIVLVPSLDETNPISDRSNPISSTTMEQVREFESVLEKVKETSRLKEKVSPHEVVNTSFISTNQKTAKNITAVTLGSILLQPTKITSYTNLNYTSEKKVNTTEKPFTVKQSPVIIAKSEDKAVKQTNTQFPQPRSSASTFNLFATTSTDSLIKPIQKAQEDEQTAEKIYKILNSYTEKIKNAPELKNKPAPRRRSNPPIANSSKCRKSLKCANKITSNMEVNVKTQEKVTSSTTLIPVSVFKAKDSLTQTPVKIQQLMVPLCSTQDNQVVLLKNDKNIILKKIKQVHNLCPSSPIVKPLLKGEPLVNNINNHVVHYKIQNDAVHDINLINYFPSVTSKSHACIITSMPSCEPVNVPSYSKVHKSAQETQTDISMEFSRDINSSIEMPCETKRINQAVSNRALSPERKLNEGKYFDNFCVALDQHYFRNLDVLFFTSFIFLNYPSSQLFMFEATYALSRMIRSNSVSNPVSKLYTTHQMNELQTFAESRLPLWNKIKIIDDIILKKKGPHICDTMMIMIKKSNDKSKKENLVKILHEDKIEVNKCNRNPKCYGKKNGINDNSRLIKYPHPLEPTIIISNKPDETKESEMVGDANNYKKVSKIDRKRTYQEYSSVKFDVIEVDNPKITVPKKRKKYNKRNINNTLKKISVSHESNRERRKSGSLRVIKKQNLKSPIQKKKMKLNSKKNILRNKNVQSSVNNKYISNSFIGNLVNKSNNLLQKTK